MGNSVCWLRWAFFPFVTLKSFSWHGPYKVNDFYLNDLSPYAFGQVRVGGDLTNIQRYLFLNARYGSYTGNQLAAFLKYRY